MPLFGLDRWWIPFSRQDPRQISLTRQEYYLFNSLSLPHIRSLKGFVPDITTEQQIQVYLKIEFILGPSTRVEDKIISYTFHKNSPLQVESPIVIIICITVRSPPLARLQRYSKIIITSLLLKSLVSTLIPLRADSLSFKPRYNLHNHKFLPFQNQKYPPRSRCRRRSVPPCSGLIQNR